MCGRRPTPWVRWRTIPLVIVLLLPGTPELLSRISAENATRDRAMAALAPGRNVLPERRERHQVAPPDPSGAYPPYPLNHTFDADILTLGTAPNHDFESPATNVGTPPTNHDLETTPTDAGTPTNHGFATGDFTDWTPGGTPTIQTSGGPDGAWARLGSGASVTSAAFTVASDAQSFVLDVGWLSTSGTDYVYVYALTGPTYGTQTQLTYTWCSGGCNRWDVLTLDATAYRDQSIKLRIKRDGGTIGVDRVRTEVVFPGLVPTGNVGRVVDGGNAYARLGSTLTTGAFTVDSTAQFGAVRLNGLTAGSDQANVYVLSGAGYTTSTTALIVSDVVNGWATYRFNLKTFLGQSIKIKVSLAYGAVGVDDVGVQWVDFPGWTVDGSADRVDDGQGGMAARIGSTLTTGVIDLPADAQQLSLRYRTSDTSGTGIFWYLLSGPNFATSTTLNTLSGSSGTWRTARLNLVQHAGNPIKLKFTPQLQPVSLDDVAVVENAVPGWTIDPTYAAAAPGADADGTYVAPHGGATTIQLESSPIDPAIVDVPNRVDGHSYTIRYALGTGGTAAVRAYYQEPGPTGQNYQVFVDNVAGTTPRWGRFTLWDWLAPGGRLQVKLTSGGKVYAIAENVARQQLAEPFSQRAGAGIDTSTGSFGTSETDLAIQGGPLPVAFTRYYQGHSDRYGAMGYRWTHSFDAFLGIYGSDVAVVFGSGKEEFFDESGGAFTPIDARVKSTLTLLNPPVNGVDYRYVTKDNLTYNFEGDGDLISIVDPNGNAITLYRDPTSERITAVTDPGGRAIDFAYDTNGRLESLTGPDGAVVTYTYDANGDLIAVDKPEDARTEYAYSKHRLTAIRQRQGEDLGSSTMVTVLTNELDDVNRVIEQTDAENNTLDIAYLTGADQGVTRVTDPLDEDTDYHFDAHARTTHVVFPTGDVGQWLYDPDGNLDAIIDPAGNDYEFTYNGNGDPTGITDPLGNPTGITWDSGTHRPTQVIDARGAYTVNTYDPQGNLIQTVVDSSKDALGTTIPGTHLNLMTIYTVNGEGQVTSETVDPIKDAAGTTRSGTHLDLMTRHTYDADGNKTSTIVDPSLDAALTTRAGTHLDLTWSWTHDDAGRMETASDPNNHTTTYEYNPLGWLDAVIDPANGTFDRIYGLSGELLGIIDPLSHHAGWTYDDNGQVISQRDTEDKTWTFGRDDAGRPTTVTDPTGVVTAYEYDANGRVVTKTVDPGSAPHLNLVTAYEYDEAGRVTTTTIDPGSSPHLNLSTTLVYDAAGRVVGRELPNGGVWTNEYDDNGNLVLVTDPVEQETAYAYDAANRLVSETVDPGTGNLNLTRAYAYDAAGRLTSETDPVGTVTTYEYDAASRLTKETVDPGSNPHLNLATEYTYDGVGNLTSLKDPAGRFTYYEYDELDRLVEMTEPGSPQRVTTYEYDAMGHRTRVTLPSGLRTDYAYDSRGRMISQTVDPGTSPHLSLVISYTHDDLGRVTSITNPRGFTTEYRYDAAGRTDEIEDDLEGVVAFAWDAAGRQTTVTNARGKSTTFTHTALGMVASETDPLDRTSTYDYDLASRLETATDARDVEVAYTYDAANRLTAITPPSGQGTAIAYGYDANGRRTSMGDQNGATGWTYDAAGRILSVSSAQGTEDYTYDALGRRSTLTLPGSQTVSYAYDTAGNLETLTDWQTLQTTYTYDADGRVTGEVRPNGVETAYEYDGAGRLKVVESADGATLLERFAYGLDGNGNRTSVTITGTAISTGTESYAYDELDRLTDATYVDGLHVAYTYDANGNRLTQSPTGGTATSYVYDDADQLTSVSGALSLTYSYDDNGNRTAAGTDTFQYDWRNRLIEATVGSVTTTYDYDGDDVRVSRTTGSTTTPYLWDRTGGLPEVVGIDDTAVIHGPTGPLAEVDTATIYPLRDGIGSLGTRTDDTGAVVGTTDWDAWGNLRAQSGTQGELSWAGELRDPVTGQTYLRARDYSPGTGRFTSRDTVQPNGPGTQGYNPYAYALNNPATLTDPSGHEAALDVTAEAQVALRVIQGAKGQPQVQFSMAALFVTLRAMGPVLFTMAAEIVFMFAIAAIVIFVILVLIHLANELIRWCIAGGCTGLAGTAWSWLKAMAGIGWSAVESGFNWASHGATDTDPCDGVTVLPMGEVVTGGAVPDQCKQPCATPEAGQSAESSTQDAAEIEITLSPNPGWEHLVGQDGRIMLDAARDKVKELDAFARSGQAHVVKSPKRNPKVSQEYRDDCKDPYPKCHVDHIVDLQLGGQDVKSNMQFLDPLVNSSLGKKIERQLRCYDAGTIVTRVHWVGDPTGETW